jgi:hypothetical protein
MCLHYVLVLVTLDFSLKNPLECGVFGPIFSLERCCFRRVYGCWKRGLLWFGFAGGYKTHPYENT